ncbi:MAG: adenosylcobinamide-GDP ribazoletransferase, partial [Acidobacteriota bacterium]
MLSPGNLGLRFLGAIQFLTTIPISRSTVPPHEAAPFFPLIGAGIGALSALPLAFLPLPAPLSAALTLSLQLILTGMLHEDGLADISDGVRKGSTPERMFAIIKDSRIGSYGACARILALFFRWQAISLIPRAPFGAVPTIAA